VCHASVLGWVPAVLSAAEVAGRDVLEVGSCDVNGSVRPSVTALAPRSYVGVDASAGPGVDRVVDCLGLVGEFGRDAFDVVISTEMLEHVTDWAGCVAAMVDVLRPGGLWVVTTRSPGFPYHPFPEDHWRYTLAAMGEIVTRAGLDTLVAVADWQVSGVFVKARKPAGWSCPWRSRTAGQVFERVPVEAMAQP